MPCGYDASREARLETFGPRVMPGIPVWPLLRSWWLAQPRGANTPNWDIAASCMCEGRPGLVLVEAKANLPELGTAGKRLALGASPSAAANHSRIGLAIDEACKAWRACDPDVCISRESHYQLSNRLAFAWKLANLGVPVVLVYLGFIGDKGIADAGWPFMIDAEWQAAFAGYAAGVGVDGLFEHRYEFAGTAAWLLARSRHVLSNSPKRVRR